MFATSIRFGMIALSVIVSTAPFASADVVMLKNGGQVRGRLQSAEDAPVVVVETLLGGTVAIDESSIWYVEERSPQVEEYVTRARDIEHSVEAHWTLAEWCQTHGLQEQREEQLLLLLKLDPDHDDARRMLGHVQYLGNWVTRDEWMAARGFVKHKGRYVKPQERDRLVKSKAERIAETAWYPKIRLWFKWATGRDRDRAAEARAKFEALNDPDAVPALVNFLGDHRDPQVRMACVQLLGQLPGPKPVGPLVSKALMDPEAEIRKAAREAISQEQHAFALRHYCPALKSDSNTIVNRAAVGLRELGEQAAVPFLIEALITQHYKYYPVLHDPEARERRLALSGARHLPYGAVYVRNGFNPPPTIEMRRPCSRSDFKNAAVRDALKEILGQDFGYDRRRWTAWWRAVAPY